MRLFVPRVSPRTAWSLRTRLLACLGSMVVVVLLVVSFRVASERAEAASRAAFVAQLTKALGPGWNVVVEGADIRVVQERPTVVANLSGINWREARGEFDDPEAEARWRQRFRQEHYEIHLQLVPAWDRAAWDRLLEQHHRVQEEIAAAQAAGLEQPSCRMTTEGWARYEAWWDSLSDLPSGSFGRWTVFVSVPNWLCVGSLVLDPRRDDALRAILGVVRRHPGVSYRVPGLSCADVPPVGRVRLSAACLPLAR